MGSALAVLEAKPGLVPIIPYGNLSTARSNS